MKVIDVYKQYFNGECVYNEVERKGVVVTLTATSDCGNIMYEVGISFFPHRDAEDAGAGEGSGKCIGRGDGRHY